MKYENWDHRAGYDLDIHCKKKKKLAEIGLIKSCTLKTHHSLPKNKKAPVVG